MAFGQSPGHHFFNSWALWQKMTFVLACGIVVTIAIGLLKLWYDTRKLKKYTKVDKGKQAATPEMLEAQPVTAGSVESKKNAPFGIRAIQSGIEIDGVWISRSNTPAGSSRNSISELPRSLNNSQLEIPQAALYNGSSRNSSRAPSSSFDRAVSAERIPNDGSRSSSPGRDRLSAAPVRCSNCNHNVAYNSSAPSGASSPPNGAYGQYQSGDTSSKSSRRTSDESDYMGIRSDIRAYESAYMRHSSVPVVVDPRTDLDLLQSHRMSHVAETGQLTPRVRRPGNSGEWASIADHHISSVNGVNYFTPQKTPSPPLPIVSSAPQEQQPAPRTHTRGRSASSEAKQGVSLMESYAPKAPFYPDTYQPRGPQHQYSYDQVPYEVKTEQNHRDTQVLRKVNSGFEILRPGTFTAPTLEEVDMAERQQQQSKKLQKRRRSSETRPSAFVESV
ncbi:hypothetical protein ACEQ8H_003835 [Pleosporales sp. CAS-2024a]